MEIIVMILISAFVVFMISLGIKGFNEELKRDKQERENLMKNLKDRHRFDFKYDNWRKGFQSEIKKEPAKNTTNQKPQIGDNKKNNTTARNYYDDFKTGGYTKEDDNIPILRTKQNQRKESEYHSNDLYRHYSRLNLPPILPDETKEVNQSEDGTSFKTFNYRLKPLKKYQQNLGFINAWHLVYYVPSRIEDKTLYSNSILAFKNGNEKAVQAWSDWAAEMLSKTNISFKIIIRALGSKEIYPNENCPLNILGRHLERKLGAKFLPNVLKKKKTTQPLQTLNTKEMRLHAIGGSYEVYNSNVNLNGVNVLILDDIITSGTTMNEIMRVLKQKWYRGNYYLFCLGKTSYDDNANENVFDKYGINRKI